MRSGTSSSSSAVEIFWFGNNSSASALGTLSLVADSSLSSSSVTVSTTGLVFSTGTVLTASDPSQSTWNGLSVVSIVGSRNSSAFSSSSLVDLIYTLSGTAPASMSNFRLFSPVAASRTRDRWIILFVSSVRILNVNACPTFHANPTKRPRISLDFLAPG